jgi:hypothetical protein
LSPRRHWSWGRPQAVLHDGDGAQFLLGILNPQGGQAPHWAQNPSHQVPTNLQLLEFLYQSPDQNSACALNERGF